MRYVTTFIIAALSPIMLSVTRVPVLASEKPEWASAREWAIYNYGQDAQNAAAITGVPYEYIMSVIMLECGGRRDFRPRFEKHIYERLLQVRSGRRDAYECATTDDLAGMPDDRVRERRTTACGEYRLDSI